MSTPPDLPDTDDPWLLLDISPGASPAEVRRAYLQRIKLYKPDVAPMAFRRIRAAFEAVYEEPVRAVVGEFSWDSLDPTPPREASDAGWQHTVEPTDSQRPWRTTRTIPDDRITTLVAELRNDLAADEREAAVVRLLAPEHAVLAHDPRLGEMVVRVACSVALSRPDLLAELDHGYHDILLEGELEQRRSVLVRMRSATAQWPAWRRANPDFVALDRFVELSAVLPDEPLEGIAREVLERAVTDPAGFLARLDRLQRDAPDVLALYRTAALDLARRLGGSEAPPPAEPAGMLEGFTSLLTRNDILSRARVRRWVLGVAGLAFLLWLSPARPMFSGVVLLAIIVAADQLLTAPTERIWREVLRPAIAAFVWRGHALESLGPVLREAVASQSFSRRWLDADVPTRYPELLANDEALATYAATARLHAVLGEGER